MPHSLSKNTSKRSIGVALILTLLFGLLGFQRLYLGRYLTGIAIILSTACAALISPAAILVPLLIMLHDLWVISGHNFLDGSGKLVQPHLLKQDCSLKSFRLLLFLNLFLGFLGAHRFYAGKQTTATLILTTVVVCLILSIGVNTFFILGIIAVGTWVFIDMLLIMTLHFRDSCGIYVAYNHFGSSVFEEKFKHVQNPHTMPNITKKKTQDNE